MAKRLFRRRNKTMKRYSESLEDLKVRIFEREMRKIGDSPERYGKMAVRAMARSAFKNASGNKLRSLGAKYVRHGDRLILTRVKGEIQRLTRQQIEQYSEDETFQDARTFGQQISSWNMNQFYGYDVFSFIKENDIEEYDLSKGVWWDEAGIEHKF